MTGKGLPPPPYHHGDLRRVLVEAALALVMEEQDWGFSLRAVARRAGVSHNAPYNHFADKSDLLGAVAAACFETLRHRLQASAPANGDAGASLVALGAAYIRFGIENPARYRLMFGPAMIAASGPSLPLKMEAAMAAKAVLANNIARGVQDGSFAACPADPAGTDILVLTAWAGVHGLTMLAIDGLAGDCAAPVPEQVARTLLGGIMARNDVP